jgi:hypothetical protein
MSAEKLPTPPTPESDPGLNKEKNKVNKAGEINTNENIISVLGSRAKSFWGRMSEKGAKIANQVYEGLYKIPVVNRIVGKMEIAYNQFWIDRHQEKAAKFKEKMDSLDLHINTLDQSKKEIKSVIESLKQQNIPGIESLQIKLQDIDRQKEGLLNERDRAQSKFEARDNKLKLYTNERDRVADKLIRRYEEKLKPMEAELERLQTSRNKIDLLVVVTEVRHKESLARLDDIEKKKTRIEEALRKTGMSEKEIRNFESIKVLEGVLADGREKLRIEKENLARHKAKINEEIAKVDAKANSYRDKREEFVHIKERRPIKIDVAARQRGGVFTGEEKTTAHPRGEAARETGPVSTDTEKEDKTEEKTAESKDRSKDRLQVIDYINGWNTFLKETYKKDAQLINAKDFLRETGLRKNKSLDFDDFKRVLKAYLIYRKLPTEQFDKSIDLFYKEFYQSKEEDKS